MINDLNDKYASQHKQQQDLIQKSREIFKYVESMQKHEKDRSERRLDDLGGSSAVSLSNSINNSKRVDNIDINQIYGPCNSAVKVSQ